jgi:hypothetical protein
LSAIGATANSAYATPQLREGDAATLARIEQVEPQIARATRVRRPLAIAWQTWSGAGAETASRALLLAGLATLFLNSAATFQAVYTFRVPYLFVGAAALVGFPFAISGWRRAPEWIRWSALALALVYLAATLTGHQHVLRFGRAGSHRNLIYLADLGLGLASVGLILGLHRSARWRRDTIFAVSLGAFAVGVYGLYQWFALHESLPLAHVNNTLDTNGITFGRSQGPGIFGWDRINGTFPEPHSLAAYLAACLPVTLLAASWLRGRRRVAAFAGFAAICLSFLLTISVPLWAALLVGAALGGTLYAVGRGWSGAAAIGAATLVLGCGAIAFVATQPSVLAGLTNRAGQSLNSTTEFRLDTWRRVIATWSKRPILGQGAGQSSVRLAELTLANGEPTHVLPSAQGIWAASLVDAGIMGFGAWVWFFTAVIAIVGAALVRRPKRFQLATFVAVTAAILTALIGDDRLQLAPWVLIGIALTAAVRPKPETHRDTGNR